MCERRPFEKQRGEASICTQSGAPNYCHSDFGVKEIEVNLRCQAAGQTGLVLFDSIEREKQGGASRFANLLPAANPSGPRYPRVKWLTIIWKGRSASLHRLLCVTSSGTIQNDFECLETLKVVYRHRGYQTISVFFFCLVVE